MSRALRVLAGIAVPAALLLGASPAAAHPMPHSVVQLDVHETSVTAELELPADDFSRASGIDLSTELPEATVRAYLGEHIHPATTEGAAWEVTVGAFSLSQAEQTDTGPYRELTARVVLTPPPGGDPRHFTLDYDVIVHQVVTHTVLVSVRDADGEEQVGTIAIDNRTMTVPPLTVDVGAGAWPGFLAMVQLGSTHILEGTDHLLFLLVLLLPAPLLAAGGRWHPRAATETRLAGAERETRGGPTRDSFGVVGRIARITLAFTLGHSVALAASALGHLDIPAWPVEAFIAASILVGAVHAVRPLFPGREAIVAGVFGLGHGMAFSFTLAEMNLSTGQLVLSLLGFNLGIELVQLLLVLLALPSLLILARLRAQPALRVGAALLTAVAAAGWLLDRVGVPNVVARAADSASDHPTQVLVVLAATAAIAGVWALSRRRREDQATVPV